MIARKRVPRPYVPITTGRGVVLGLALAIILGALFWWDFPPKQYSLHAGEVSRVRISAPRAVTFDSPSKTKEAQDKAAAAIPESYNPPDVQIGRTQLTRAQAVLNYLDALRHDPYTNLQQKQQAVAEVPEMSLTSAVLSATLGLEDARWTIVSREALAALEQTMRTEIR